MPRSHPTPPATRFLPLLCAILALVLGAALVRAAEPSKSYSIPAGSAETTLKALADQSGRSVMFVTEKVKGVRTNEIKGDFTVGEAINRLLSGTPLFAVPDKETGGFAVRREVSVETAEKNASSRLSGDGAADSREGAPLKLDAVQVFGEKTLNMDLLRSKNDIQPYYIWTPQQIENSGAKDIGDFFQRMVPMNTNRYSMSSMTGTLAATSNISLNGLSGNAAATLGTQNTLILVNGRPLPGLVTGPNVFQADLNGIPLSAVERIEVLPASASSIYGASAAGGVVNVILKYEYTGVEARMTYENTFDSDAPTRRVSVTAGMGLEGGKTNILVTASYQNQKPLQLQDRLDSIAPRRAKLFSLFPGGAAAYYGLVPGMTSGNLSLLSQPVVTSANGTPLFTGSTATLVQVPVGYLNAQANGIGSLQANVGNYNLNPGNYVTTLGSLGLRGPLGQAPTEKGVNLIVRRQMTPWLELYAEAMDMENYSVTYSDSAYFFSVTVPATVSGNPFGQAVRLNGVQDFRFEPQRATVRTLSLSGGAKIRLPYAWNADLSLTRSRIDYWNTLQNLDTTAVQAAVTSGALNLITDLSLYPINGRAYAQPQTVDTLNTTQTVQLKAGGPLLKLWAGTPTLAVGLEHTKTRKSTGYASFAFPGRSTAIGMAPTAAASSLTVYSGAFTADDSAYAELTVPLVDKEKRMPGLRQLDLQVAGRYDKIEQFSVSPSSVSVSTLLNGSTTYSPTPGGGVPVPFLENTSRYNSSNGTVGLKYQPIEGLFVRASASTGFVPPAYVQLQAPISTSTSTATIPYPGVPTTSPWFYTSYADPRLNATYSMPVKSGGNPNLKPETSRGMAWGVVYEPRYLRGFRVSVDYTRVEKEDAIIIPSATVMLANESRFSSRITRGPANAGQSVGPVTLIDTTYINAPSTITSSYNIEAAYTRSTETLGTWRVAAVANSWQHYKIQSAIDVPFVEQLGNPFTSQSVVNGVAYGFGSNLAKFKGNLSLDWTKGPLTAGWTMRYVGPYTTGSYYGTGGPNFYAVNTVNGWVSDQSYHDIYGSWKFGRAEPTARWWRKALSSTTVQVGVKNVFNTLPPYDGTVSSFFTSQYGDLVLASYYVTLKRAW